MALICWHMIIINSWISWLYIVRISITLTWILIRDELFSPGPSDSRHLVATIRARVTPLSASDHIDRLSINSIISGVSIHCDGICRFSFSFVLPSHDEYYYAAYRNEYDYDYTAHDHYDDNSSGPARGFST